MRPSLSDMPREFRTEIPAVAMMVRRKLDRHGPYDRGTCGGRVAQDGVLDSVGAGTRPIMPVRTGRRFASVSVSHMSEGDLVRKVLPTYPPLARVRAFRARLCCRR